MWRKTSGLQESLTARCEKAKSRLDEVKAEIHEKNSCRKSIEHYLAILTERKEAVTEYDATLWHGNDDYKIGGYRK